MHKLYKILAQKKIDNPAKTLRQTTQKVDFIDLKLFLLRMFFFCWEVLYRNNYYSTFVQWCDVVSKEKLNSFLGKIIIF